MMMESQKNGNKDGKSLVDSATTVTRSQVSSSEREELEEYVMTLRKVYGYDDFKWVWFHSCQNIGLYEDYKLETDQYSICCTVIDINPERALGFKFAIIAPEIAHFSSEDTDTKNLVFLYCKDRRELSSGNHVVPVVINIEKSKANKEKGNFEFIADINAIIKLSIHIQIHRP
jgi:hypothetical protein